MADTHPTDKGHPRNDHPVLMPATTLPAPQTGRRTSESFGSGVLTLEHVDRFLQPEVGTPVAHADDIGTEVLKRFGPQPDETFRSEPYPLPPIPTQPIKLTSAHSSGTRAPSPASSTVPRRSLKSQRSNPNLRSHFASASTEWQNLPTLTVPKQAKFRPVTPGDETKAAAAAAGASLGSPLSISPPAGGLPESTAVVLASAQPSDPVTSGGTRGERTSPVSTGTTQGTGISHEDGSSDRATASPNRSKSTSLGGAAPAGSEGQISRSVSLTPSHTSHTRRATESNIEDTPALAATSSRPTTPLPRGAAGEDAVSPESDAVLTSGTNTPVRAQRSASGRSSMAADRPPVPTAAASLLELSTPSSYAGEYNPNLSAIFLKRNADFHMLFKEIPISELLTDDYGCALQRDILVQGRLYITESFVCFHANIFGWISHLVLQFSEIVSIEKRMTALIIPNAIQIATLHSKYFFASFIYRDAAYSQLVDLWRKHHPGLKVNQCDDSPRAARGSTDTLSRDPIATEAGVDDGKNGRVDETRPGTEAGSGSDEDDDDGSGYDDSYDSDWSEGSSYTEGTSQLSDTDVPAITVNEKSAGSETATDETPAAAPSGLTVAANTTYMLARTIQNLVHRVDEAYLGTGMVRPASRAGYEGEAADSPTVMRQGNRSENVLAGALAQTGSAPTSTDQADTGPPATQRNSLARSASARQPGPSTSRKNPGGAVGPEPTDPEERRKYYGKRIGAGASTTSNVHTTPVLTTSYRSAMLNTVKDTNGKGSGDKATPRADGPAGTSRGGGGGEEVVPPPTASTGGNGDSGAGSGDKEATSNGGDDQAPADGSTPPTTAVFPPPFPSAECPCLPAGDHYDVAAVDETFPCVLSVLYKLIFNGDTPADVLPSELQRPDHQSFFASFTLDYLTSETQKNREISLGPWSPSSSPPPHLTSPVYARAVETRPVRYIRPINAPIGPKQATCEITEACLFKDFQRAVVIDVTTFTPDVPSGGAFHTKARVCLMHAGAYRTRMIVTHKVVWTKSSWIKGPVEKGSIEGNNTYFRGLGEWLVRFLSEHPEFASSPTAPSLGLAPAAVAAVSPSAGPVPAGEPRRRTRRNATGEDGTTDEARRRHHRKHGAGHKSRRNRTQDGASGRSELSKAESELVAATANLRDVRGGAADPAVLRETPNPVFRWLYSWLPVVTPTQMESSIRNSALPGTVLASAQAMSSTLESVTPGDTTALTPGASTADPTADGQGAPSSGNLIRRSAVRLSPSTSNLKAMAAGSQPGGTVIMASGLQSYGTDFSYWLISVLLCLGIAVLIVFCCLTWMELRILSRHLATLTQQQAEIIRMSRPVLMGS